MLTERTCVIGSVRRRRPLSRTSRTIGEFDKVKLAAGTRVARGPVDVPQSIDREGITRPTAHYSTRAPRPGKPRRAARPDDSRVGSRVRQVVAKHERYRDRLPRPDLGRARAARRSKRRSPSAGIERFRARQIFRWIYRRGVTDLDGDDRSARASSARRSPPTSRSRRPRIVARERSTDGTEKFLLAPGRRPPDRVGLHPRHAGDDLLHLDAGRLRDGVRVLPDGQDGPRPQPDGRRNRRPGARARRRARPARHSRSTSS